MRSATAILTLAAALFAGGVFESANATPLRGLASHYGYRSKTANGEMMNPQAMTAAHPSLPFGTHVRVTDVGDPPRGGRAHQRPRPVRQRPHHRPLDRGGTGARHHRPRRRDGRSRGRFLSKNQALDRLPRGGAPLISGARAPVAELVDAPDSKSGCRKAVPVRLGPGAHFSSRGHSRPAANALGSHGEAAT